MSFGWHSGSEKVARGSRGTSSTGREVQIRERLLYDREMLYRIALPDRAGYEGTQGLIDRKGRVVLAPTNVSVGPFHDGLAAVAVDYSHYGFVDLEGRWAIEPRFYRVGTFAEGRCLVEILEGDTTRFVFIDATGREVFPFEDSRSRYVEATVTFSEGRLPVTRGGKVGFLDRSGALVIEPQFEQVLPFREGLAPACLAGQWGMIDLEGRWVIEPRWMRAFCFQNGVAAVVSAGRNVDSPFLREHKKDDGVDEFRGLWGLVDRGGQYLHRPAFDYVETELATSMALVDRGVLGPTRFVEGRAIVRVGGKKWGLLRNDGSLCGAPNLEKLGEPSEGLALAKKKVKGKSLWGFVDLEGEWVLPPTFAHVQWPLARFSEGMCPIGAPVTPDQGTAFRAIAQYGQQAFGYVDRSGVFTITPRFWQAMPFEHGLALVGTEKGRGYIDVRGELVWEAAAPTEVLPPPSTLGE